MERRESYWYTVIKYIADFTKGEPLNVGILIENSEENKFKYILLDENNLKLKAIFENNLQQRVYKFGKDYFDYSLKKIVDGTLPYHNISVNRGIIKFLSDPNEIPDGFYLSEPQFAKTNNWEQLFNNLTSSYIGARFLNTEIGSKELIVKEKATTIFAREDLLNNKLKSNVKIKASPTLPFKYQIDFAYRIDNKIELIHSAPGNIELLPDWLEKVNLFSTKYDKADKISLLYDTSVNQKLLNDTKSVINILKNSDDKINAVDINSTTNAMGLLIKDIKENATNTQELEKIIAI